GFGVGVGDLGGGPGRVVDQRVGGVVLAVGDRRGGERASCCGGVGGLADLRVVGVLDEQGPAEGVEGRCGDLLPDGVVTAVVAAGPSGPLRLALGGRLRGVPGAGRVVGGGGVGDDIAGRGGVGRQVECAVDDAARFRCGADAGDQGGQASSG